MCSKTVSTCSFVFDSVPDRDLTHEFSDKIVSGDPLLKHSFMLKYCHNGYKTQDIWNKAAVSCPLPLKFVPDWFLMGKMIEKHDSTVFSDDYVAFGGLDSDFITFFNRDTTRYNINRDGDHFDYRDPKTINHVRLMSWYYRFKQCKVCKKR